jgi:hypothetical protein
MANQNTEQPITRDSQRRQVEFDASADQTSDLRLTRVSFDLRPMAPVTDRKASVSCNIVRTLPFLLRLSQITKDSLERVEFGRIIFLNADPKLLLDYREKSNYRHRIPTRHRSRTGMNDFLARQLGENGAKAAR